MTLKQFLSLPASEQALEAAKVLVDKPWKHKIVSKWPGDPPVQCDLRYCSKCGKGVRSRCTIPDPLTLDWNTAKSLQGECDAQMFTDEMLPIWKIEYDKKRTFSWAGRWIVHEATLIHYIAACMEVKKPFDKENE